MSDKINTGGPAFPLSPDCAISPIRDMTGADISSGMSLRAYIATSALSGLCAHPDTWGLDTPGLAKEACRLADALIAALAEDPAP